MIMETMDYEENRDESEILKYYLEDLETLDPKDEVESHLRFVLNLLYDYINQGVSISELVCEANLALVQTVREYSGDKAGLEPEIEKNVRAAIEALIAENGSTQASDEALAQRVNELSDISVEMVQELGRQPTVEELAQRLQIPAEEVDALIRMSMEAI